jgi:hypothetical protein
MKVDFKITYQASRQPIERLALVGAAVAAVVARAWLVPTALDATDAVNFALALERYSLPMHQPHFPGYPLYILAARGLAALSLAPPWALVAPSLTATAPLVLLVGRAVKGCAGCAAGLTAAWLVGLAPPLVEVGAAPGSDGLALAVIGAGLSLSFIWSEDTGAPGRGAGARTRWRAALPFAIVGLGLGVRPSWAPLVLSVAVTAPLVQRGPAALTPALLGLGAGTAAWLAPFVWLVGPRPLLTEGMAHLEGHFARFGGAITATHDGAAARALRLASQAAHGLELALAIAVAWLVARRPGALRPAAMRAAVLGALVAPYALWAWLAQNVDRARHAAPLTLALAAAIALACATRPTMPRAARAAGPLAVASVLAALLHVAARQPTPWRRDATLWIASHLGIERVVVLGTHLPRVARYYAPALRIGQAADAAEVARVAGALGDSVVVVASSEITGLERAPLRLEPLQRFGGGTLYRARTAAAPTVHP